MPPVMMPPPASNARLERLCTHLVPGKSTADVSTESAAGVVRYKQSLRDKVKAEERRLERKAEEVEKERRRKERQKARERMVVASLG